MTDNDRERKLFSFDRLFSVFVGLGLTFIILILPLCCWVGKKFFGWQPPAWIDQALRFFNG